MKPSFATFVYLVLFISYFKLVYAKHNCSEEALGACLMMLEKVGQSDEMAFATTMMELNTVCRTLRQGIVCVDNYMKHCFNVAQRKVFKSVLAGSRHTMNDLCVNGKMQTEYLQHAPCFKNVSIDNKRCGPYYHKVVQLSNSLNSKNMVEDVALRRYCCAITEFIRCQIQFTTQDCGADASHFLHLHTERMSGPLIHQHCIVFTFESGSCQEESNASVSRLHSSILVISLSAIYFLISFSKKNITLREGNHV